jgi:DDE superfamily endonuclease
LALRCRIVLAYAEGLSNAEVVKRLGVAADGDQVAVRFIARRLEGLADEPRPGAARAITDEQVERVLVLTLETTPKDATHWSTRAWPASWACRSRRSAAPGRHLQAVHRPPVRREGPRHRRAVPEPARGGHGVVRGRQDQRAGAGPHRSSTHKTPAIQRWLLAHPRVHLHFTPTYSSWLNPVERWFAELTTKWLRRGTHRSVAELQQSIQAWIDSGR